MGIPGRGLSQCKGPEVAEERCPQTLRALWTTLGRVGGLAGERCGLLGVKKAPLVAMGARGKAGDQQEAPVVQLRHMDSGGGGEVEGWPAGLPWAVKQRGKEGEDPSSRPCYRPIEGQEEGQEENWLWEEAQQCQRSLGGWL